MDASELQDVVGDVEAKMSELYETLVAASITLHYIRGSDATTVTGRAMAQERRNGLLAAYSIMSGEEAEAIYERVEDDVTARIEKAIFEAQP
jgi:hypothetical protein